MKVLFKNFKAKDSVQISFREVLELLHSGIPEGYSDMEKMYSNFITKYREIHDYIYPEEYLHIGFIVKSFWDTGIKSTKSIELFEPSDKPNHYGIRVDIRINLPKDLVEGLEINLKKLYDYDRD